MIEPSITCKTKLNCTTCKPKIYKERLKGHMNKQKNKICPKCDKKYKLWNVFRRHVSKCGQQEKFICDYCNKVYKKKDGLVKHMKFEHGFGNVLTCSWCSKKFHSVSKLIHHNIKHTKEKNFECTNCGRKFVSQAALVSHTRLHTGETPYPCDLCDERFLSASRRMEHKKRKHIGPTNECTLCDMKFLTKFQLRDHFHRHFKPSSKLFITKDDLMELKKRGKVK